MKKWLPILVAAALLVSPLLLEALAFVSGQEKPDGRYSIGEMPDGENPDLDHDAKVGWLLKKDTSFQLEFQGDVHDYRADTDGYRIGANDMASPTQRPDVAVLGDEVAMGFGVPFEDTLSARLQRSLAGQLGQPVYVRNMAGAVYDIGQTLLNLRHYVLPLKPRVLVVELGQVMFDRSLSAYCRRERRNRPTFVLDGGQLRAATQDDAQGAAWRWLRTHSRAVTLAWRVERTLGRKYGIGGWWNLNSALIDAIQDEAKQAGIPVLFVFVPQDAGMEFPALDAQMVARGAAYINPTHAGPGPSGDPSNSLPGLAHLISERVLEEGWLKQP